MYQTLKICVVAKVFIQVKVRNRSARSTRSTMSLSLVLCPARSLVLSCVTALLAMVASSVCVCVCVGGGGSPAGHLHKS